MRKIFLLATICWLLAAACFAEDSRYIRVAIIEDTASLNFKIKGFYQLIDATLKKPLSRGKNLKATVTAGKEGILVGNISSRTNKLMVKSDDPEAMMINNRTFRGDIQFIKKDNGHLLVVNYIDLEDYIKGILYNEASHYWPENALKAQAVVCRSYALYQMQESPAKDYDVTSSVYSQVYGGRGSERFRTNKAVDQTRGEVVAYQGKLFPAYYHATCGGHTEDASFLWNINIPPLKGLPCGFCKDSPHFRWHAVLSLEEIAKKFQAAGYSDVKNIKDIAVLGTNSSGRLTNLRITTDKKEIQVSGKDLRSVIGPDLIRSTKFSLQVVEGDAVFEGFGWGHGVGFCQWGGYFMAKAGSDYKQILQYYYPETSVKTF